MESRVFLDQKVILFFCMLHSIHQIFGIIFISKTYLASPVDEKTYEISGYDLLRYDYLNNQKNGGACLYFKKKLMSKKK